MRERDTRPLEVPEKTLAGVRTPVWVKCGNCGRTFLAAMGQEYCQPACRAKAWHRKHPSLGSRQAKLFEVGPQFDGETIDVAQDQDRLGKQLDAVRCALDGGRWWTLSELSVRVRAPEASVSARIRDLRKEKFGGHKIERRRVQDGHGLHEYRLEVGHSGEQC